MTNVSDKRDPFLHLTRSLEELLLAAGEGLAMWREHTDAPQQDAPGHPVAPLLNALFNELRQWFEADASMALATLREALRDEAARWAQRAPTDPAARRMQALFEALAAVVADRSQTVERPAPAPGRHAPRRPQRSRME